MNEKLNIYLQSPYITFPLLQALQRDDLSRDFSEGSYLIEPTSIKHQQTHISR